MLSLSLMPPEVLNEKLESMIAAYAHDLIQSGAYETDEAAWQTAREEIDGYFDNGQLSPNQVIYSIFLAGVSEPIGCIWISKQSAQDPSKSFLSYIQIEPAYRGQGFAKRALKMGEKKVVKFGMKKIGLNVFAHNETAKQLYLKAGYRITYEVSLKSTGKITRYLMDKDLS